MEDFDLEEFYGDLCKYSEYNYDVEIQKSIWTYIGWVNCLRNYEMVPDEDDLEEMISYQTQITEEME